MAPNYVTVQPTTIHGRLNFLIEVMDQIYTVGNSVQDDATRVYLNLATLDVFFDFASTFIDFSRYQLSRKWLENSSFDRLMSMGSRVHLTYVNQLQIKSIAKITNSLFLMVLEGETVFERSEKVFETILEKVHTSEECQTLVGNLVLKLEAYNLHNQASNILQVLPSSWSKDFTTKIGLFDGCSFDQWSHYYGIKSSAKSTDNCNPTEVFNWIRTENTEVDMKDFCDKSRINAFQDC